VQDPGNPSVAAEQAFIARLAEASLANKRRELVDLYKRVVDGVGALGFPMSLHFETPYGFSPPAFETFASMLEHWAP
ncbi:MAG: mycobacterial-type methylenetetrahydrofolate reductase, partial [Vicinamibacterales bacterium]|nr:mycobacterial-type methylenetetrahydrofolate reductase [Vicinamibacterales bacterium]